jgi:hypothetical protein
MPSTLSSRQRRAPLGSPAGSSAKIASLTPDASRRISGSS